MTTHIINCFNVNTRNYATTFRTIFCETKKTIKKVFFFLVFLKLNYCDLLVLTDFTYEDSVWHSSDLFMFLDLSNFVSSGDTLKYYVLYRYKFDKWSEHRRVLVVYCKWKKKSSTFFCYLANVDVFRLLTLWNIRQNTLYLIYKKSIIYL